MLWHNGQCPGFWIEPVNSIHLFFFEGGGEDVVA